MIIRSQLSSSRACSACHVQVLRSFISAVTVSLPVLSTTRRSFASIQDDSNARNVKVHLRPSRHGLNKEASRSGGNHIRSQHTSSSTCRYFATTSSIRREKLQDDQTIVDEEDAADLEDLESKELSPSSHDQDDMDNVPWYLRDKSSSPFPVQHTMPGQDMPELPEHSPELLQPIVSHVLEKLGLTFLDVVDLRTVSDPPPALGSNLIMVIASARSERHLHASADKFCRWLRTEYKLTPYADGLLGRNEMKIAIRRRVRRAKMMSAVGAGGGTEGDITEGIRSSWICVHVGRVEGGILPETAELQSQKDIVGFGTQSTMSTIVVQMMTEEKREELKLGELWRETKRRQDKSRSASMTDGPGPEEESSIDEIWSATTSHGSSTQPDMSETYNPRPGRSDTSRHTPSF